MGRGRRYRRWPSGFDVGLGARPEAHVRAVRNESGASIATASVVVLDATNQTAGSMLSVKLIDSTGAVGVRGVIVGGAIADKATGFMVEAGPADTLASNDGGAITVGEQLITSDHGSGGYCEQATGTAADRIPGTHLGYALEAIDDDGTILVFVDLT